MALSILDVIEEGECRKDTVSTIHGDSRTASSGAEASAVLYSIISQNLDSSS